MGVGGGVAVVAGCCEVVSWQDGWSAGSWKCDVDGLKTWYRGERDSVPSGWLRQYACQILSGTRYAVVDGVETPPCRCGRSVDIMTLIIALA